jgi:hypothetical protein
MASIYIDIDASLERAKNRSGIVDDSQDEMILDVLGSTSGSKESVVHYRPYYVAALLLEQDLARQSLSKAGDVEFTNLTTVIASLRSLQNSLDISLGLTVPPGLEAVINPLETNSYRGYSVVSSSHLSNNIIF